jgi:hypothetical protein
VAAVAPLVAVVAAVEAEDVVVAAAADAEEADADEIVCNNLNIGYEYFK